MIKTENFEKVEIKSQEELRNWLIDHHTQEESIWIVTYKKSKPEWYVSKEAILDEVLCFGWIDGIRRKLDEHKTMQLIGPRRKQHWSKTYKDSVEQLRKDGLMMPAGEAAVAVSIESGLWSFLDDVDALITPADLQKKLETDKSALDFFNSINPSSKRFVLRWVKLAKTDKTRKKRIDKLFQLSLKGEKLSGS